MLHVRRVLETAVYCDNLAKTVAFYRTCLTSSRWEPPTVS